MLNKISTIVSLVALIFSAQVMASITKISSEKHDFEIEKLLDAGLDSVRVSLNSVQEEYYNGYFRPRGYRFADPT